MATNATRPQQSVEKATAPSALAPEARARRIETTPGDSEPKPAGYGLPCAKCRLYYPADLDACPTCHHRERVSPSIPKLPPTVKSAAPAHASNTSAVEQEREEFLRQFKSQLAEARAEASSGPASVCTLGEHHPGEQPKGEICKGCYERLQERLDVCEAALHLDVKEAAQIIYDAVWADPTDPNKTYQNAANALLAELRKRAGMNSVRGAFQSRSD